MSFREKSAWAMAAMMLASGLVYIWLIAQTPEAPIAAPLIPYVLLVVVLSVAVQVVLALASPKEANAAADERERIAIDRAGNWSGMVLATGVVLAGGSYAILPNGAMLFHYLIGALVVSQIAEYGFQIFLFRRGL